MLALLKLFFDLCLLRAKPQDVPASSGALGVALGAYGAVSVLLASTDLTLERAVPYALVDTLILALLTHGVLRMRRYSARFPQTLTALAGSGALLGLAAWPVTLSPEPSLLLLVMVIWSLAVSAHILRHALAVALLPAILISLGFVLVGFLMLSALFPAA